MPISNPPHRVLLIDDDRMGAELVELMFAQAPDISFASSVDAEQALVLVRQIEPTILLLDLRMPRIDGFEVIQRIRARTELKDLPIVMLSSEDDPQLKARGFEVGANDYLVKWPNKTEMIARVRYHSNGLLNRRERDSAFVQLEQNQALLLQRTSELEASQAALFQAQKMEALGDLTGGIAHDFNNVLQIIGGSLSLLKMYCRGDELASRRIETALAGIARGSQLSSQLLSFARRQPLQPEVISITRLIRDVSQLLRHGLGENVEVDLDLPDDLWRVKADPGKLENVLLNLAINSRDAMSNGGLIRIAAENIAAGRFDKSPDAFVRISVQDNGCGIAAENLEKIFEPFFTTKEQGKGTGLGLSMAYGFVTQSDGFIKVDSTVSVGTRISIYLRQTSEASSVVESRDSRDDSGNDALILVVEDEDDVRSSTLEILQALGYRTLSAHDGLSALQVVQKHADIDIVFTDVVMPGPLRSVDFVTRAKKLRPGLIVLFTSGYVQSDVLADWSGRSDINFMSKPYTPESLTTRLRYLVQTSGAGTA